jgi:hypothetical protein
MEQWNENGWGRMLIIAIALLPLVVSAPSDVSTTGSVGIGVDTITDTLTLNGSMLQLPTQPTLLSTHLDAAKMIEPWEVVVQGEVAYVAASFSDAIMALSIQDPTAPFELDWLYDATLFNGVRRLAVNGNYLYAGSYNNEPDYLVVINITDPANMSIVGNDTGVIDGTSRLYGINGLVHDGEYLYAVDASDNIVVFDISDPARPRAIDYFDGSDDGFVNNPWSGVLRDDILYVVTEGNDSIVTLNVSQPGNISIIGAYSNNTLLSASRHLAVRGGYAFATDVTNNLLAIFNVSNPANPQLLTSLTDTTYLNGANDINLVGDYAYITAQAGDYLTIVDISDPSSPAVVTGLTGFDGVRGGFEIHGRYAYMTELNDAELSIVDLHGFESHAATIGSLASDTLVATHEVEASNALTVHGGMTVGARGLLSTGPVSVRRSTGVPAPSMYLTETTHDGDHNCDDAPETCCDPGYHMCTVPEMLEGGRMIESEGTDRSAYVGTITGYPGAVNAGAADNATDCDSWSSTSTSDTAFVCDIDTVTQCTTISNYCDNAIRVWCCLN